MARFREGERVRLSGEIPGLGIDVEGRLGTFVSDDGIGANICVDGEGTRSFNPDQVKEIVDLDTPIGILGKAAQEILEHHVSVEDRDFDTVPQCYMTVGDMRELVRSAKEEGVL